ncbi:MAG: hypothetical protein FWH40_07220, partial [Coriobacteriia bacterium]|nr:hypothetical protein [Coriobacteriia bacterium]
KRRPDLVEILNEETGTIDECLDDSSFASDWVNFAFLQFDAPCHCRIELLGRFVEGPVPDSVHVLPDAPVIAVGRRSFVEASNDKGDVYYVSTAELEGIDLEKTPYYAYTRKDLIQVDGVIHPRCVWGI